MKDAAGEFMWPGFRENSRIIKWMIDRVKGKVPATETPIGLVPRISDLDLTGCDVPASTMEKLLAVNPGEWKKEAEGIEQFYNQFGNRLPDVLKQHLAKLKAGL
jgi:phosphoenolpyruvate carboxykinase (GTP)